MLAGPLTHTALIALLSTGVAAVLVVATLENEQRQQRHPTRSLWLLYLPLLVPQIAFLYGLVVAAERLGIRPPTGAGGSGPPAVRIALCVSFAGGSLSPLGSALALHGPIIRRFSPPGVFGACGYRSCLPPLLTAAAVGLAVSIGQYLPTQLLGAGRVPTVTTEAVALASGGNRRLIGVWALVQAGLPLVGFMIAVALPSWLGAPRRTPLNVKRQG